MLKTIITSDIFDKWLDDLRDRQAKAVIEIHIRRMGLGNIGKVKNVGNNVFEKKIYYGAGYRLYFVNRNDSLIFILCAGDKSTQSKDIKLALVLVKEVNKHG